MSLLLFCSHNLALGPRVSPYLITCVYFLLKKNNSAQFKKLAGENPFFLSFWILRNIIQCLTFVPSRSIVSNWIVPWELKNMSFDFRKNKRSAFNVFVFLLSINFNFNLYILKFRNRKSSCCSNHFPELTKRSETCQKNCRDLERQNLLSFVNRNFRIIEKIEDKKFVTFLFVIEGNEKMIFILRFIELNVNSIRVILSSLLNVRRVLM